MYMYSTFAIRFACNLTGYRNNDPYLAGYLMLLLVVGGQCKDRIGDYLVNNVDDSEETIVNAMKDSGVLKEWKEKLDKLDEALSANQVDVDAVKDKAKKKTISTLTEQHKEMIASFIQEYKADHKLVVSEKVTDSNRRTLHTSNI